jgi:hypothetical protein
MRAFTNTGEDAIQTCFAVPTVMSDEPALKNLFWIFVIMLIYYNFVITNFI